MTGITRRELLAGASAGAAALLFDPTQGQGQTAPPPAVVFAHTTVVNADVVREDVALAVAGDRIAAIGATDAILRAYPRAEI